jgi:DNA replicative helicase MCM subunit Mcm2 (Cdc46/Mcm family)
MKKTLRDLVKLALPIGKDKREAIALAQQYLEPEDLKELAYYLRMDKCFAQIEHLGSSLAEDLRWPVFKSHLKLREVDEFVGKANAQVIGKAMQEAYTRFAPQAMAKIASRIAPNIVGMDPAKQAAALQLFALEPLHVLLIGDPGTGKTDILRGVHEIAPIGSYGLGSGISGVGLSAMAKGEQIIKGLLPLADGGIACIDELNLIKGKDLASLYNAMEKGFVTYDKGSKHEQLPARVRVCATANPSTQTFVGKSADVLRKQIPFGDALLSRFHLVCIVRKPSDEQFSQIAHTIVQGKHERLSPADLAFLKGYVRASWGIDVHLPVELERKIVAFITQLKHDERKFLMEVGPRTVVGTVRLVKAAARAELQETVREEHLEQAFALVRDILYVRKGEE